MQDLVPTQNTTHTVTNSVIDVALVGNPNTGKTTVFNALTGLRQKVGNYPGVTVEKKTGVFTLNPVHIDDEPNVLSHLMNTSVTLLTNNHSLSIKNLLNHMNLKPKSHPPAS